MMKRWSENIQENRKEEMEIQEAERKRWKFRKPKGRNGNSGSRKEEVKCAGKDIKRCYGKDTGIKGGTGGKGSRRS